MPEVMLLPIGITISHCNSPYQPQPVQYNMEFKERFLNATRLMMILLEPLVPLFFCDLWAPWMPRLCSQ